MDLQSQICRTCAEQADVGYQKATPTTEDIRAAFPGMRMYGAGRPGSIHMTKKLLLHLVLSFYERLNGRENKRGLAEMYAANCLGVETIVLGQSLLSAITQARQIWLLVLFALEKFLPPDVRRMQRLHSIYSSSKYPIKT